MAKSGTRPQLTPEQDSRSWAIDRVRLAAGAALLARGDGTLIAANMAAEALAKGGDLPVAVKTLIVDTRLSSKTQSVKVAVGAAGEARIFDLTFVPLPDYVFVAGRDVTLEMNLVAALSASRELYRDVALCAGELSFETNGAGVFTWVSANGFINYSVEDLRGVKAVELFGPDFAPGFSAKRRVDGLEGWCAAKDGTERCISITAVSVQDNNGDWAGARGVARDVTAQRLKEREINLAHKREELIAAVVTAMRAQVEPRRMLLAAADALAAATDSDCVAINSTDGLCARIGKVEGAVSNQILVSTSYQGAHNGDVVLLRGAERMPYTNDERLLLDAILPHLGVALALTRALDAVATAAHDDTANLFNREAFLRAGSRMLSAAERAGKSSALLAFDWKAADDEISSMISKLGFDVLGAEIASAVFVLLEGADGEHAEHAVAKLKALTRDGDYTEFTVSAIVVRETETGEGIESLLGRAQDALAAVRSERRVDAVMPQAEGTSC